MSGQSDHDRALERLLRAMPDEHSGPTPACIDAERLAAWSEGGLTPLEREAVKAHLASCPRCLAVLAVFSETSEVSVSGHEAGSGRETGRVLRWPVKWVVPITTAAAAVLIWMVLPARPPERALAPATQAARDETAAAAPAAPAPERFDAPSGDQARESAARQTPPPPATPTPRALSKTAGPAEAEEAERRREQSAVTESVQLTPAQEPAAKPSDTLAYGGQRAANESAMSDRASAPRPAAPPPSAQAMPAPSRSAALMRADAAPVEIRSPDPARRWQIRGALVERSTNGGSSWQPATTPTGAIVTAGTSPAADVCWLVGPNGTVLRTTDGSRFEAVNAPATVSLVSVLATDANHATVRASDGTTYSTADGGKSWR